MTNKPFMLVQDMILLDMKKVIIQPKSVRVVVYFYHKNVPGGLAFSAALSFHAKDSNQWFTSFRMYEGENISGTSLDLQKRIEDQMKKVFGPYFDMLLKGDKVW